jgi:hypothetical protein
LLAFFASFFLERIPEYQMKTLASGHVRARGAKSAPQRVLAKLIEKTRLRAALAAVQADIDAVLPALNAGELQELQSLMASEIQMADAETEGMCAQIAEEAELAQTTKAVSITIARRAAAVLGMEAEPPAGRFRKRRSPDGRGDPARLRESASPPKLGGPDC